ALGRVLLVSDEDYHLFISLARAIIQNDDIPKDAYWRIDWASTCQPIDTWHIRDDDAEFGFNRHRVYGFDRERRKLEDPIGGFSELPTTLHDFMNATQEAVKGLYESEDWKAQKYRKPVSIQQVMSAFDERRHAMSKQTLGLSILD
ncbi:hypothetical protein MPER_03183, partial [Moniliophthora perniciosa FA553]